jgi:hypothetical protein
MKINLKDLNLDLTEKPKVRHINKLLPYQKKFNNWEITEIDLTVWLLYAFSETNVTHKDIEERVNDLEVWEFEDLTKEISFLNEGFSSKKHKA